MNLDYQRLVKITLIIGILDFIYLSITGSYYLKHYSYIQGKPVVINPVFAALSYLTMTIVAYIFTDKDIFLSPDPLYLTAIFGFGYAIFNLVNASIFADYPVNIVIMDTLWGSLLGYLIGSLV